VLRRWEYGVMSDVTSVLYLQAPADMRGGNFRVWDPNVQTVVIKARRRSRGQFRTTGRA